MPESIEAEYYLQLPSGPPAQGDLWTGLPLPGRDSSRGLALVITPRCDLAQKNKCPVLNYLPVVSMDQLLQLHGGFQLIEEEVNKTRDSVTRTAKELRVDALEIDVPLSEVVALAAAAVAHLVRAAPSRQQKFEEKLGVLKDALARVEQMEACLRKRVLAPEDVRSWVPQRPVAAYKEKVIKNKLQDLHFLPPFPPLLASPSVALLRHIGTCDIELLRTASACPSDAAWHAIRQQTDSADVKCTEVRPERILRIKSPYVESIMTRFATLFIRVGLIDFTPTEINNYIAQEG